MQKLHPNMSYSLVIVIVFHLKKYDKWNKFAKGGTYANKLVFRHIFQICNGQKLWLQKNKYFIYYTCHIQ